MRTIATLAVGIALVGCGDAEAPAGEGPLLASVGQRELYLGDARGVVSPNATAADSIAGLTAYAERWARDAAVAEAASAAGESSRPEVERLVHDYRDRLLRLRYEDQIASERLDTAIGEAELQTLFAEEGLTVDAPGGIARIILLRYTGELPEEDAFDEDWAMLRRDTAAKARVIAHGRAYAELALADDEQWRDVGKISALAGGLDPERIRSGANVRRKGAYLRVLDYVGPGGPAPFAYVRDRLRKTALTRRRDALLAAERARLFEEARTRDAVKIYVAHE